MSSQKRKRAPSSSYHSSSSSARGGGGGAINPLSHSQSALKQFVPAGLSSDLPLPSERDGRFPHRALALSASASSRNRNRNRTGGLASSSSPPFGDDGVGDDDDVKNTHADDDDDDDDDDDERRDKKDEEVHYNNDEEDDEDPSFFQFATRTGRKRLSSSSTFSKEAAAAAGKQKGKEIDRAAREYQSRLGPLVAIVRRSLAEGDIPSARRAFGLLARARLYGDKKVDLRRDGLWELGAECLRREGEEESPPPLRSEGQRQQQQEEGGGGMGRQEEREREREKDREEMLDQRRQENLEMFYEGLVSRHPWHSFHKWRMSSVDFYPGLFTIRVEGVRTTYNRAQERLEDDLRTGRFDWGDDAELERQLQELQEQQEEQREEEDITMLRDRYDDDDDDDNRREEQRMANAWDRKVRRAREVLRRRTLQKMREAEAKMKSLMANHPFSSDLKLLKIWGIMLLYLAELSMPVPPRSDLDEIEGARAREAEVVRARKVFRTYMAEGGAAADDNERFILELVEEEDDDDYYDDYDDGGGGGGGDENRGELPVYSAVPTHPSLPFR